MDNRAKLYDVLNSHPPNISQVTKYVASIVTGTGLTGPCLIIISEPQVGN